MSAGSILESAGSDRAAASPARPDWAASGRRPRTVPAVTPAAASRNFRREEPVVHFRVLLILHLFDWCVALRRRSGSQSEPLADFGFRGLEIRPEFGLLHHQCDHEGGADMGGFPIGRIGNAAG